MNGETAASNEKADETADMPQGEEVTGETEAPLTDSGMESGDAPASDDAQAAEEPAAEGDSAPDETTDGETGDSEATDDTEAGQETQQRRRESRDPDATGTVTIEGESYPLRDWSSSGFGVFSCALEFEENARVPIDVNVTHSKGTLTFSCKAVIVRSNSESGEVAGAFVEMSRDDRVAVAEYFYSEEEE